MKKDSAKHKILIVAVTVNTVIFLLLSILHFYWTFGGKLWYEDVLPTNSKGTNRLTPTMAASFIIAFGLLLLASVTATNRGLFNKYVHRKYFRYATLGIAILFSLRAIGDFRFIGFFKSVSKTRFGINDTLFFSPLCLFIALLSLIIFMLNTNKSEDHGTTKH